MIKIKDNSAGLLPNHRNSYKSKLYLVNKIVIAVTEYSVSGSDIPQNSVDIRNSKLATMVNRPPPPLLNVKSVDGL